MQIEIGLDDEADVIELKWFYRVQTSAIKKQIVQSIEIEFY